MERSQEYEPIILDLQKSQLVQRPKRYLLVSVVVVIVLGVIAGAFAGVQYWKNSNQQQQRSVQVNPPIEEATPTPETSPEPVVVVVPVETSTTEPTSTPTATEQEAMGFLNLHSSPKGAEIVINGEKLGNTPLLDYELKPGTYTVKFAHQGKISEQKIAIKAGEITEYTHQFEGFGALRIKVIPSRTDIYVNGQFAGRDPLSLGGLLPGTYTISARKSGYATTEQTVIVEQGDEPQEVLLILKRLDLDLGSGRSTTSTPRPAHPSER